MQRRIMINETEKDFQFSVKVHLIFPFILSFHLNQQMSCNNNNKNISLFRKKW